MATLLKVDSKHITALLQQSGTFLLRHLAHRVSKRFLMVLNANDIANKSPQAYKPYSKSVQILFQKGIDKDRKNVFA